MSGNLHSVRELRSLFFAVWLRKVCELRVLFEMVSLKMAPVRGEDENSPNKRLIISALAWEGSKERFSSTKLSLGTTDS